MAKTGRGIGQTLTKRQAAINLAQSAKQRIQPRRYTAKVSNVTDRETTGTVETVCYQVSPYAIVVQVRSPIDLAADDYIWIRSDQAVQGTYVFDGFVEGGGTGNNDAGAPIPWSQTPGVTSPPGSDLTVRAPDGNDTVIGTPGNNVVFDGDVQIALDDLTDVNAPAPNDNDVLTWDDGGGEWVAAAGGGGAPTNAEYLVLTLDATLSDERQFVAGDNLTGTDAGAGGTYTLDVDDPLVGGVDLNGVSDLVISADGNDLITSLGNGAIEFDIGGSAEAYLDATGFQADTYAFIVKNTSGGAVANGQLGYIDAAGEFKTTTTAYSDVAWAVCTAGGANNADVWVTRRGRVTVNLNGNCSAGDYLYTSTTAGQAQPQSYMRPEVFAVALTANGAGAGGTCEALLLCHTRFISVTSASYLVCTVSTGNSAFVAAIDDNAGAHGGQGLDATHVPYDTISSGADTNIAPYSSPNLGYMRLYNSTRSTYRLVVSIDTTNDVITTVSSTDTWADNDAITIESQTVTSGAVYKFIDVDLSQQSTIPVLARSIQTYLAKGDSGGASQFLVLHPWETYSAQKQLTIYNAGAGQAIAMTGSVSLIQRRFTWRYSASGAATADNVVNILGYWLATP